MIRIGVDFGGTKIEAVALDETGRDVARLRRPTRRVYEAALEDVRILVDMVEDAAGAGRIERVGVGVPGSPSPVDGRIRNANSTWLNGRPLGLDLAAILQRKVRLANDANCFALSEAHDGAGAGVGVCLAVILGTGCGAGLVVGGGLIEGANGVAGEIGHMPLPWPTAEERASRQCWCGRVDCLETYVCGPAFEADYAARAGTVLPAERIAALAGAGDPVAGAALDLYIDRLARGLAAVGDMMDPDVIVLGGGMSKAPGLYAPLRQAFAERLFSDVVRTRIEPARWGDSSGVRGAARLWPSEP